MDRKEKMERRMELELGRQNNRRMRIEREEVDEEDDYDIGFTFEVGGTEGIDPLSTSTIPYSDRKYDLVWWIEPGQENWAPYAVCGWPNPKWDRVWHEQSLGRHLWPGFVHVEIIRRRNPIEPGTSGGTETVTRRAANGEKVEVVVNPGSGMETVSHGMATVNRVRVPLPDVNNKKREGRFDLVKSNGLGLTLEGSIQLGMKASKIRKRRYRYRFDSIRED